MCATFSSSLMLQQSKPERLPMLRFQASLMSVNKDNKDRSLSLEFDKIKLIRNGSGQNVL